MAGMNRALVIGFAMLLSAACLAQDTSSVVLPAKEAQSVTRLCSRSGPERIDGGWTPATSDIALMEHLLADASKAEIRSHGDKTPFSKPFSFRRQYVGIIVNGKRLIYINAFPVDAAFNYWTKTFVSVCDGGPAFWGIVYDPATGKFSDLHMNGFA